MKSFFIYDSVISPGGQRGVNRYFLKFLEALFQNYKDRVLVYSQRTLDVPRGSQLWTLSSHSEFLRTKQRSDKLDVFIAEQIANISASVFYSPYFGEMRTKIPQAYTLPDMIYEKFPQYFPPADVNVQKFIAQKRACFERAELILPISKSAAHDLQEHYSNLSADRIKVVYLGVHDLFFEPQITDSFAKPYFLFVGNRQNYKNFLRFIDAFGKSGLQKHFDLQIISPTLSEFTADEKEIMDRHKLAECIRVAYAISDEALRKFYAEAYAFIYPTEYEGFGLPVVEALASGTLVLTSNTSSLSEVGGIAPLYFDPYAIDDMVNVLQIASQMPAFVRNERIQAGKKWATQFTWENSQRTFITAMQTLL